jgi:hypothetical protein
MPIITSKVNWFSIFYTYFREQNMPPKKAAAKGGKKGKGGKKSGSSKGPTIIGMREFPRSWQKI